MTTRILAFDVSSSCIGYSILDVNDNHCKYIDSGYFKPKNKNVLDIFDSLNVVEENVLRIIKEFKPNVVAIEDIIKFMKGHSSANTIIKLSVHNRFLGMTCLKATGKKPILCNVMSIRHFMKKRCSLTKIPSKEELPGLLEAALNFSFPWETDKKGKKKSENYDRADAIACAFFATSKVL